MLMRAAPSATIVPVAIDGSWELMRYSMWPIPFGVRVKCTVLAPISRHEQSDKEVVRVVEDRIRGAMAGDS
jgi:1-acyl-sn-glycerol-3-phosphate acyltransferase